MTSVLLIVLWTFLGPKFDLILRLQYYLTKCTISNIHFAWKYQTSLQLQNYWGVGFPPPVFPVVTRLIYCEKGCPNFWHTVFCKIYCKYCRILLYTVFWCVFVWQQKYSMFVYKTLTPMATKNDFSGTLKLFLLFTKTLVSFIYDVISFTQGWRWWPTKRQILDVWQLIELMTGLPRLFSLCILNAALVIWNI